VAGAYNPGADGELECAVELGGAFEAVLKQRAVQALPWAVVRLVFTHGSSVHVPTGMQSR
jgi:hypothetical protein